MNRLEQQAHDALVGYETKREPGRPWYGPAPREKPAGVWSPRMTEQQKQELEQYIKDHDLPF
jgi:hypothetical protein